MGIDSYQASSFGIFDTRDEYPDWLKAQDIEPTDYVALVELLDKEVK